ncbi:MAG: collagen-like protein [Solirubrobacteraceae bacterium]
MSHPSPRSRLLPGTRLRWALLGTCVAAVVGAPFAVGQAIQRKSVIAGTRTPVTGHVLTPTLLATQVETWGLDVVNESKRGGAAQLSCRAIFGTRRNACLRTVNRANGLSFQFDFRGAIGGLFRVGNDIDKPFPDARPFVTNATGVATGLNADRLDGFHAQDIIDQAVAQSSVQVGPQGPQGPAGAQGSRGPQGAQGQSGPPGTPLVARVSTPASSNIAYGSRQVVDLPSRDLSSSEPATSSQGADLLPTRSIVLDPGTYIIQTTFRAYDLSQEGPDPFVQYGVAGVFLDGQLQTTLWTPDIPADGNNAGMASDTTVVAVSTGAPGVVTVRGVVRQNATGSAGSTAEGGVSVIVTGVNTG